METKQSKCFSCYKVLGDTDEKCWMENDGLCPNCSTQLSTEDETCYECDKPAIQEDKILYCKQCFEIVSEESEDEDEDAD